MNYAPTPCSNCSGLLIQSGILEIIGPNITFPGKGKGTHYDVDDVSEEMLSEVNMRRTIIELTDDEKKMYSTINM